MCIIFAALESVRRTCTDALDINLFMVSHNKSVDNILVCNSTFLWRVITKVLTKVSHNKSVNTILIFQAMIKTF